MYITSIQGGAYESDLEYPNHKFMIGDIVKTHFKNENQYFHWLVEGIRYDPVWYVWQYQYRILETNETSHSDIKDVHNDIGVTHTKVA